MRRTETQSHIDRCRIFLALNFGALKTEAMFYIIDADILYKALLGRPWLHEHRMVASTLHQCIKYVKDGKQRRINGDIRPFGVHEVKYEEARYFNSPEKARSSEPNRKKLEIWAK